MVSVCRCWVVHRGALKQLPSNSVPCGADCWRLLPVSLQTSLPGERGSQFCRPFGLSARAKSGNCVFGDGFARVRSTIFLVSGILTVAAVLADLLSGVVERLTQEAMTFSAIHLGGSHHPLASARVHLKETGLSCCHFS